ncbi:MAG: sulfate respiration complex protein HmcD [Pseudomonadota bacterium]
MGEHIATLQEFMVHTKSVAYILMAGGLIGLPLWWLFITGRDEKKRTY